MPIQPGGTSPGEGRGWKFQPFKPGHRSAVMRYQRKILERVGSSAASLMHPSATGQTMTPLVPRLTRRSIQGVNHSSLNSARESQPSGPPVPVIVTRVSIPSARMAASHGVSQRRTAFKSCGSAESWPKNPTEVALRRAALSARATSLGLRRSPLRSNPQPTRRVGSVSKLTTAAGGDGGRSGWLAFCAATSPA